MHEERLAALAITLPGPFPPHDPLDALSVLRAALGSLDHIERVLTVTVALRGP